MLWFFKKSIVSSRKWQQVASVTSCELLVDKESLVNIAESSAESEIEKLWDPFDLHHSSFK